jgi:hypothetical protein
MDANEKPSATEATDTSTQQDVPPGNNDVSEFKIEIKKLDVPVKPRGVLAE